MTAPLPERMRAAAEMIEQLNAMSGMGLNCTVSPAWLRREADSMDAQEAQT